MGSVNKMFMKNNNGPNKSGGNEYRTSGSPQVINSGGSILGDQANFLRMDPLN